MEIYKGIKGKWEFCEKEKAFINYCEACNYDILECKQYVSKTMWKFKITDNIIESYETLNDDEKFDKNRLGCYIEQRIGLEELRNQIKAGG